MKTDIHPQYNQIKVTCACGNTFEIGTTLKELRVDVCSACHPFYTGTQKFVDTAGRVDKFKKKMETAEALRKQALERLKAKNTNITDLKDIDSADKETDEKSVQSNNKSVESVIEETEAEKPETSK